MSFPRSVVEFVGNGIAFGLHEPAHRFSLRPVLSQQTIGVLVAAAFPGVVRTGEVDR